MTGPILHNVNSAHTFCMNNFVAAIDYENISIMKTSRFTVSVIH